MAEPQGTHGLTIHTASQSPSFVRSEISRLLGWPENRVRVRTAFLGGGFGAKLYIKLEAMVAVCALLVRKPVRIALTMDEQFYTITKHGATVRIKTGVKNDGRMIAREVETFWNGGAYADIGPRVTQKSGFTAAGPYDIEHVALDNYAVYTNEPPAGALRGFGISQLVWAYERQADIIARTLRIDPLEFRRRNALRERPAARDRHDRRRHGGRGGARRTGGDDGVGPAVRPRHRHDPARPRHRDRRESVRLADDVDRGRAHLRRRKLRRPLQHRGHGPGVGHDDGADRGGGAGPANDRRPRRSSRHRRHAVRHGDARVAIDVPHGERRPTGGGGCARAASAHRRGRARHRPRRARVPRRGGHLARRVRG